jgi:hypothetical protein
MTETHAFDPEFLARLREARANHKKAPRYRNVNGKLVKMTCNQEWKQIEKRQTALEDYA